MFQGTKVQAIEWLKTTVDPKHYQYNPPNLRNVASFNQNFTVLGKHVADDSALVGDKIKTSTGVFLWLVNRGLKSMYNFGIVPSGLTMAAQELTSDDMPLNRFYFVFNSELILPYSEASGKQVTIGPDPATSFSVVRQIGGLVSGFTDTAPTNIFALNGKLTAGTIQDTRDIMQRKDAGSNNPGKAFAPTDICQQSLTNKDQFAASKVFNGVTFTVGSDVELDYSVPDRDNYYSKAEAATEVEIKNFDLISYPLLATTVGGLATPEESAAELFSAFLSPWDVGITNGAPVNSVPVPGPQNFVEFGHFSNYELPNINICGDMNFDVTLKFRTTLKGNAVNQTGVSLFEVYCSAQHYYMNLNGDGSIRVDHGGGETKSKLYRQQGLLVTDSEKVVNSIDNLWSQMNNTQTTTTSTLTADHTLRFEFDAQRKPTSLGEHGMYVGSLIRAWWTLSIPVGPTLNTIGSVSAYSSSDYSFTMRNGFIRAAPRNIYAPGELGPCRVMRYDELSDKMDLQFTGDLLVECVPQGQVAPYVKNGGQISGITTAPSIFPLISAIYNTNRCPVKRVWMYQEYLDFVETQVANLSVETIMKWMEENPAIREVVTQEAGGGWGNLLGGLGGQLGQTAGEALGGVLGSVLGSAGQYGAMGQYGAGAEYSANSGRMPMLDSPINPLLVNGQLTGNPYRAGGSYVYDQASRRRLR